jgi:predicted nucleic acid-binding protein
MSRARSSAAIQDLIDLPIERFPQAALLPRAVQLMDNVTVYDALYLALAEALECSLLTSDEALAGVPGCTTTVVVLRSGG